MLLLIYLLSLASSYEVPVGVIYSSNTDSIFVSWLINNVEGLQTSVKNTLQLSFSFDIILTSVNISSALSKSD